MRLRQYGKLPPGLTVNVFFIALYHLVISNVVYCII